MNTTGIQAAQAKLKQMRAAGTLTIGERKTPLQRHQDNPTSLAWALKAYYYDLAGVDLNADSPEEHANANREYRRARENLKGQPKRQLINRICKDCVGYGADPAGVKRIATCECSDCPLHTVRPYQRVTGCNGGIQRT